MAPNVVCLVLLLPLLLTPSQGLQGQGRLSRRSNIGSTDLELVMQTLSQRLDTLETENQVLRNQVQALRSDNGNLQEQVQDLQNQQAHLAAQPTSGAVTCPACPTSPDVQSTATSSTTPATGSSNLDLLAIIQLRSEVEELKSKLNTQNSRLQDLQQITATLTQNFTTCIDHVDNKIIGTDAKYHLIESIVLGVRQTQQGMDVHVTDLHNQTDQLERFVQNVVRESQDRSQNLTSRLDSLEQTLHSVTNAISASASITSPAVASTTNPAVASTTSPAAAGTGNGAYYGSPVGFQVIGDSVEWSLDHQGNLVWPRVVANVGNGYDQSTLQFRAPVAGMYLFLAQMGIAGASSGLELALKKNGLNVAATSSANAMVTDSGRVTFMDLKALVELQANEAVWLTLTSQHHNAHLTLTPGYSSTLLGTLVN